jgi:hypothetical protein
VDTQTDQFRLIQRVKDETFEVELISQYSLLLQIGKDTFRFCITDQKKNRCLWLEDYKFSEILPTTRLLGQLEVIYDSHPVLRAGYWSEVRLSVINNCFSLVPAALFDEEQLQNYLGLVCHTDFKGEELFSYKHTALDAVNAYYAEKVIADWFRKAHPNKGISVLHQTSSLLEGVLANSDPANTQQVFLNVENDFFHLVVLKNKALHFCNYFEYANDVDFLYFVMFVFDEFQLNPDKDKVTIWGELMPDSAIFNKLYRYVRNVQFGNKPQSLRFGYVFDDTFDHRYFDLYSMHLCN